MAKGTALAEAFVEVGADLSPLRRAFSRAISISRIAGNKVGRAFKSGITRAVKKISLVIRSALSNLHKDVKLAPLVKVLSSTISISLAIGMKAGKAFAYGITSAIKKISGVVKSVFSGIYRTIKWSIRKVYGLFKSFAGFVYKQSKRIAIALLGIGVASVVAFVKFEKQMSRVSTMLSDQTDHLLPGYSKSIRRLAVEYGESTQALSDGLYDILSASVDASKAIEVLEVATRTARAGFTETSKVADVLTTILNAYQLDASRAADVTDILTMTVNRGKTTMSELSEHLGMVVSTAAMAGTSLQEVAGIMATMTRAGIKTTEATTSLNSILRAFLKPTDDAKRKAKELGFEMSTAALRSEGLVGIMEKISEQTPEALAELFPMIRGIKGVAAAISGMQGLRFDVSLMSGASGRVDKQLKKIDRTLSYRISRIKERFKDVFRSLGMAIVNSFDRMSVAGKMFTGSISSALPGVVSTLVELWNSIDKMDEVFGRAMDAVADKVVKAAFQIQSVWAALGGNIKDVFFNSLRIAWDELSEQSKKIWESVTENASTALDKIKEKWDELYGFLSKNIGEAWDALSERLSLALQKVKDVVLPWWEKLVQEMGKKLGDSVKNYLKGAFSAAYHAPATKLKILIATNAIEESQRVASKIAKGSIRTDTAPFIGAGFIQDKKRREEIGQLAQAGRVRVKKPRTPNPIAALASELMQEGPEKERQLSKEFYDERRSKKALADANEKAANKIGKLGNAVGKGTREFELWQKAAKKTAGRGAIDGDKFIPTIRVPSRATASTPKLTGTKWQGITGGDRSSAIKIGWEQMLDEDRERSRRKRGYNRAFNAQPYGKRITKQQTHEEQLLAEAKKQTLIQGRTEANTRKTAIAIED